MNINNADNTMGDYFNNDWDLNRPCWPPPRKYNPWNLFVETDRPCLHKACPECHGTGVKYNGQLCVHMLSCPCPSCTPYCMTAN